MTIRRHQVRIWGRQLKGTTIEVNTVVEGRKIAESYGSQADWAEIRVMIGATMVGKVVAVHRQVNGKWHQVDATGVQARNTEMM